MTDEKKINVLDVLNALRDAGLTPIRSKDLSAQLGLAGATMSRYLQLLVEAGWARKAPNGGYVIGPSLALANSRQREDAAETAERLHDVMQSTDPEPPRGCHTDGEMFLGLRYLEELRSEMKTYNANVQRLLDKQNNPGARNERAIS